ncbi:hypothetical protein ACHQM5_013494 [Ranunculus cassubicifolius]
MNQTKHRAWFPKSNSSSNGASLHDHKTDNTSVSVTGKHRETRKIYQPPHLKEKLSDTGNSKEAQMGSSSGDKVDSYRTERPFSSGTSTESAMGETNCAPLDSSLCQSYDSLQDKKSAKAVKLHSNHGQSQPMKCVTGSLENQISETSFRDKVNSATEGQMPLPVGTSPNSAIGQQSGPHVGYPQKSNEAAGTIGKRNAGHHGARWHNSPQCSTEGTSHPTNASLKSVYVVKGSRTDVEQSKPERGGPLEHRNLEQSKIGKPQFKKGSPDRGQVNEIPQFNICLKKHKTTPTLKPSILEKNREKREYAKNDPHPTLLRPGMVLLKSFIAPNDQIKIIEKCQDLGVGPGGFYQPGYNGGAKLSLRMMCLGKDWDPQTRSYDNIRSIDGASPPIIPVAFRKLVREAIQASYNIMREKGVKNPDKEIPWMEPDICIVNFYKENGKLGLHQDKDETDESIKKGLPVVSFSIGDSAEFLYGDERDVDKAQKIELKSGDILIFGGKSRRVFHGVTSIKPDSAPKFLRDEADLRPGRLNLTFRQY